MAIQRDHHKSINQAGYRQQGIEQGIILRTHGIGLNSQDPNGYKRGEDPADWIE